jgi:hypothetical protein
VKTSDFDVMEHRDILFNDCGDRVATLLHLRHKGGGGGGSLVGLLHHITPPGCHSMVTWAVLASYQLNVR